MENKKIEVKNLADLENFLKLNCNDNFCYTISIVFSMAYITKYQYPSKIPYNEYSNSYDHKFWKNGFWRDFPAKSILKYQNSDGNE
jgi:hypothetical protein